MVLQIFRSGAFAFPAGPAILLSVVSFLLVLFYWRGWARRAFGEDESGKRSKVSWLLRPSNLLIVLAALFFMYGWPEYTWHQGGRAQSMSWEVLIVLAFIIRYWENDALRNVDVDKVEEPVVDEKKNEDSRENGKFN